MDATARFLYEIGTLKRIPRAGWLMAGVPAPESVAEHTFRTAVVGYVLACAAGADPARTALLCLFHDLHEARVGDLHAMAKRYLSAAGAERASVKDQTESLPGDLRENLRQYAAEFHEGATLESRLARDADRLECLLQALEYRSQGNTNVADWIHSSQQNLHSDAARSLAAACLRTAPTSWWQA